jgi:hypothetical protein
VDRRGKLCWPRGTEILRGRQEQDSGTNKQRGDDDLFDLELLAKSRSMSVAFTGSWTSTVDRRIGKPACGPDVPGRVPGRVPVGAWNACDHRPVGTQHGNLHPSR